MKFRVRRTNNDCGTWVVTDGDCFADSRDYIRNNGTVGALQTTYKTEDQAQKALDSYLATQYPVVPLPPSSDEQIRTFETGATRDTTQGKLDYVKALSPIVLRRYVQYLDKHRKQSDGSYRDFDNWKKGIPQETYHSSNGRHFFDAWLLTEGYTTEDNHGSVDLEDALCAQLFNIQGRLHEVLKAKGGC